MDFPFNVVIRSSAEMLDDCRLGGVFRANGAVISLKIVVVEVVMVD